MASPGNAYFKSQKHGKHDWINDQGDPKQCSKHRCSSVDFLGDKVMHTCLRYWGWQVCPIGNALNFRISLMATLMSSRSRTATNRFRIATSWTHLMAHNVMWCHVITCNYHKNKKKLRVRSGTCLLIAQYCKLLRLMHSRLQTQAIAMSHCW